MSTLSNIGLIDVNITGRIRVAALLGLGIPVAINNCFSTGSVTGTQRQTGGLVGFVLTSSTIANSYSTANVSGVDTVGGFISEQDDSTITNCYSAGAVSGTIDEGGFCGINTGTITDCFYDSDTSGQSDTGKGEPKTTVQMQTQSTFTNWDFADIWYMLGYPKLSVFQDLPPFFGPGGGGQMGFVEFVQGG